MRPFEGIRVIDATHVLAGPFAGLGVPLLAAQILWINLLTHGITGVAMGAEQQHPQWGC